MKVCRHAPISDEEPPLPTPLNSLYPFWERRNYTDRISDLYREWLEKNQKRIIMRNKQEKKVIEQLGEQYEVLTFFFFSSTNFTFSKRVLTLSSISPTETMLKIGTISRESKLSEENSLKSNMKEWE